MTGGSVGSRNVRAEITAAYRPYSHERTPSLRPKGSQRKPTSEKVLTQTTSSKQRVAGSPVKSPVKGKVKAEKGKSLRKSRNLNPKLLGNSLNMPHLSPPRQEFIRNNSQQLTCQLGELDKSMMLPLSLSDVLVRTSRALREYERTCGKLRKQNREMEKQLLQAKTHISQLEKTAMRRSKEL